MIEAAYYWRYSGIYSFYDIIADKEDVEESIDKNNWNGDYRVVNEKYIQRINGEEFELIKLKKYLW